MLFNSYDFLLGFLPLSIVLYYSCLRWVPAAANYLLLVLSLCFYAYWDVSNLPILLGSAIFNYLVANRIMDTGNYRRLYLAFGVTINVLVLCYFKYCNFFLTDVLVINGAAGYCRSELPLAVSFFTLQQITYLIYCSRNAASYGLPNYLLFVSFFPQLLAGPIVYYNTLAPQLEDLKYRKDLAAMGLMLLVIGLGKKLILAEYAEGVTTPRLSAGLEDISLPDTWGICLGLALRTYFDVSAYGDMAVGLGLMFGIRLPVNFRSPWQANSLIEFWQRWHITITRFLMNHVFRPLSRLRHVGLHSRTWLLAALLITFVISGFWHGAGWQFVLWGAFHGVLLVLNHLWRRYGPYQLEGLTGAVLGRFLTNLSVVVSLPLFYAGNLEHALKIYGGMVNFGNMSFDAGLFNPIDVAGAALLFLGAWFLPNSQTIVGYHPPDQGPRLPDKLNIPVRLPRSPLTAVLIGLLLAVSIMSLDNPTEFIYFQF